VEVGEGCLVSAEADPEEAAVRQARIAEKLDALRRGEHLN
jgi:hypothetical protein